MGQVWRASDEILGRPVAVKLLRTEYAEDPEFLDRFRAEARRTAALSHPGIASVFDYGETSDPDAEGTTAYLVMELVDGEPLSVLLAHEGRLSAARTLDVLAQSALALDSAHQAGVVHRDVKPSNLLLRRDGVVKVTDFGIAHAADEAPRTEAGLVVGTAAYLSPEQVACRPATPASDIYALGVVAYECLAGRRPFTGEHPIALALAHRRSEPPPLPDEVPDAVRELVRWTMSKAPRARPRSAGALGRQALVTRAGLPEVAGPDDPETPASEWLPVMSGWHPALGREPAPGPAGATGAAGAAQAAARVAGPAGPAGNDHVEGNGNGARPGAPVLGDQTPGGPAFGDRDPDDPATGEWTPDRRALDGQAPDAQPAGGWAAGGWAAGEWAAGEWAAGEWAAGEWAAGEWPPEPPAAWEATPEPERATARPRLRRRFVLAAIIMLTVVVAGAMTAAARQRSVAMVPSVAGLRMAEAGQALARAGFEVQQHSRPDRTVRAGVVLAQEPAAGTRLAHGRPVAMVVSSGPPVVVLDPERYLGRPLDDVRTALIRLGLRVSVTGRAASVVPDMVTAINPSGTLHQGDNVTVTVATSESRSGVSADSKTGVAVASADQSSGENGTHKGKHKDGDNGGDHGG
jgi:eukaryotic-like serine/threonine-protein kinase